MVLAAWLEEKLERTRAANRAGSIAEGRAEGFAQGFAEANREWEAWNRRREAAIERGEAFAEPTPSRLRGLPIDP